MLKCGSHCWRIQRAITLFLLAWCLPAEADQAPPETAAATQPAAASQPASQPTETRLPYGIATTDRLTGDWAGVRGAIEERGLTFSLSLTSIFQQNVHGGLQTHHGHRVTGSADYELTLDLEKAGLIKGGTVYASAESDWGNSISDDRVGSLFSTNGDALGDEEIVVDELWYEQKFAGDKARFRFGRIDLTVDFDTNAFANDETGQFLNSALINTANNPVPEFGMGAQLIVEPCDWFYAGMAAADAQANHLTPGFDTAFHDEDYFFGITELGFTPKWKTRGGTLPGSYRFGLWYDPQPKQRFVDDWGGKRRVFPFQRDDVGFYLNFDQLVVKEQPQNPADNQGLGMFFRYGWANEECNAIEHFWSLGAQYLGPVPTRDQDVVAFGFAQGIMSDKLHALDDSDRESAYELYYRIQLFPWLQLTPDFQYIINPGAIAGRDACVVGFRVQASF